MRYVIFSYLALSDLETDQLQDGCTPLVIHHQNINTYLTFNMAQSPDLIAKMGTNTGSAVEIWNPRIKAWRLEDIDHSLNLKGQPELLIRFLGVKHCPGFNELIGETHEEHPVLRLDTRKHPLEVGSDDVKHVEACRIVISNWLSPHHATGSSSTTPLSLPLLSLSPSSLSPSPIFSELGLPPRANQGVTCPSVSLQIPAPHLRNLRQSCTYTSNMDYR
jgi:hypothetical protein